MTEFEYNRMIARAIINAQTASDGGKNLNVVYGENNHRHKYIHRRGYPLKTMFELRALTLIDGRKTSFNYYCALCRDQNRHSSVIVYFRFRDETGKKYQVSFHNPFYKGNGINKYIGKGMPMRWDHKSSAEACKVLAQIYDIK